MEKITKKKEGPKMALEEEYDSMDVNFFSVNDEANVNLNANTSMNGGGKSNQKKGPEAKDIEDSTSEDEDLFAEQDDSNRETSFYRRLDNLTSCQLKDICAKMQMRTKKQEKINARSAEEILKRKAVDVVNEENRQLKDRLRLLAMEKMRTTAKEGSKDAYAFSPILRGMALHEK